jgi:2-polyprenyl-6-methoxyphenol hydroxylase-like FAD-dependent oxidoreductase
MGMSEHAVVIAGGGPAGMMLAAELALAGVDVAVAERRPDYVLAGSRAGGANSRAVEVFDQRGIADRFLAEGQLHQIPMFGGSVLDISDFPTRHPYTLGIWQHEIERIMAGSIAALQRTAAALAAGARALDAIAAAGDPELALAELQRLEPTWQQSIADVTEW